MITTALIVGLAGQLVERVADLVAELDRERVALLGAVQGERRVPVEALDEEHGSALIVRRAALSSFALGPLEEPPVSTTTRVIRPAATSPRASLTETRNVSRRPSTCSSVASATTVPPTGVGVRWASCTW